MNCRIFATLVLLVSACRSSTSPETSLPVQGAGRVPLTDLGTGTYKGFQGGLYEGGSNIVPAVHAAAGMARTSTIVPRDGAGQPSADGRIVFLSVGMSNTTQEFCSGSATNCASWSFIGLATADGAVNHTTLAIVDGARGGQVAASWDQSTDPQYDTVRLARLAPRGLTERQVQVAWVKLANPGPRDSLPSPNADARALQAGMGAVMRALATRYPNLKLVFLSSRVYAGYATTTLNPEPFAYETAFAVRWLIDAQIRQVAGGAIDATAGDLDYRTGAAPWLAWGPYLWADGTKPRNDGLTWQVTDFAVDGTHPARTGQEKVAQQLMAFFTSSPFTSCWFLTGRTCQ